MIPTLVVCLLVVVVLVVLRVRRRRRAIGLVPATRVLGPMVASPYRQAGRNVRGGFR
jgi:hypothetical protein